MRLTATETKIIDLFMRNPGRIFPAEEFYRRVWEEECFASDNTVMVHIRRLRKKLADIDASTAFIETAWGVGYKLRGGPGADVYGA